MSDVFRHITFAEASHYSFLKTLLGDLRFGVLPKLKGNEEVATLYATPQSPDEVIIKYGKKNRLGEYGCHVTLVKNGVLRDRNCFAIYEDGTLTLSKGVAKKEAASFLSHYRFEPLKPVDIRFEPVAIRGNIPTPVQIMIERARLTFDDPLVRR